MIINCIVNYQNPSSSKKSTLSDVNKGNKEGIFGKFNNNLLKKYTFVLSVSRTQIALGKNAEIVDRTAISLCEKILKYDRIKAIDGISKRGIKSHSVLKVNKKVPSLVWFSPTTTNSNQFLEKLNWN